MLIELPVCSSGKKLSPNQFTVLPNPRFALDCTL